MQLTKLALKRPVSVILLLVTLLAFSIGSIPGFHMAYIPQMERPMLMIITNYKGADPEFIDTTVTEPIEALGETLSGFIKSTSTSSEGNSRVRLEFDYGTDMNQTYMDLKTALDRLALPDDCTDPMIMQITTGSTAMMTLSVTSASDEDLLCFVNDFVLPKIKTIPGMADVTVVGGTMDYIRVMVDPVAMKQYGVSFNTITSSITANNFTIPAGKIDQGHQSISISSTAAPQNPVQLGNIPITTAHKSIITLDDVATISYSQEPANSISRYNGSQNIGIDIINSQDSSVVTVASKIEAVIATLQANNPNIQIVITSNSSEQVISSLMSVGQTLLLGVVLCMIVLFMFFGDVKASLIVGSSIPLSLLVTIIAMRICGFSLNLITTCALVVAIGMMVDNSIVTLESIFRAKERNNSFSEAAIEGCKLVGASIVASTITTIVVYLPLAFLTGMAGEMFSELGYTIVFAMIASLVSAVTLIPLFYCFFKPTEKSSSPISRLMVKMTKGYEKGVRIVLHKKAVAVIIAVLSLVFSFALVTQINIELMPNMDEGIMQITAEFRPGTRIEIVDKEIADIESKIAADTNFEEYSLAIKDNTAIIKAYVKEDINVSTEELINTYQLELTGTPNMNIDIVSIGAIPFASKGAELSLAGYDYETLKAAASDIEALLYEIPGVTKVNSSMEVGATKADILIDPLKTASYGLSTKSVAATLKKVNNGNDVSTMELNDKEYDIKVEYPQGMYDNFNALMNLPIDTQKGSIPLSEIASITFTDNLQAIDRVDGIYVIDFEAIAAQDNSEAVKEAVNNIAKTVDYGEDVYVGKSLTQGMLATEIPKLIGAIGIAIFLVFIVMAMQFESPRFSLMVMTSVIFSFIGSFTLLFFSGSSITMVSLMGILMLIGIVVNNGILFVDTVNALKAEMPLEDALVQSGMLRMRPILMTTLTTVLSMVPLALNIGDGSSILQSMSFIIIGGLITSTILVLFFMPTFYLIIEKKVKTT